MSANSLLIQTCFMLRVEKNTIQADYLREFDGAEGFALQISDNNHPLTIYNAYSIIGDSITYFRACKVGYKSKILYTYELDTDCLNYSDGQYLIDSTKYFDNTTPTNILPDGIYFFTFSNGTEIFNSERFSIVTQMLTSDYSQPEPKKFENDEVFNFND